MIKVGDIIKHNGSTVKITKIEGEWITGGIKVENEFVGKYRFKPNKDAKDIN